MNTLENKSLKELRVLYPNIKAVSKEDFLSKVADNLEVIAEEFVEVDIKEEFDKATSEEDNILKALIEEAVEEEKQDIVEYLFEVAKSKKKILIEMPTSLDADDAFVIVQNELFPLLEEQGIMVVASSSRRDMSLNGTCYVRICCSNNFEHLKTVKKYTDFKSL